MQKKAKKRGRTWLRLFATTHVRGGGAFCEERWRRSYRLERRRVVAVCSVEVLQFLAIAAQSLRREKNEIDRAEQSETRSQRNGLKTEVKGGGGGGHLTLAP